MKTALVSLTVVLVVALGIPVGSWQQESGKSAETTQEKATADSTQDKADAQPQSIDITKKVRQFNDPKRYATPPTKFKKGHVRPRKLDEKALTPGADRFSIQLPSKAPIPTVTFYQGRLYVSGGFHSKEFYCFDANDGKLVWAIDLDDDGPSSAVCQDNICVFNTESCTIFAVDCSTGKQLWSWWLGDPLMSTPTIANGLVFTSYPASGRSSENEQLMGGGSFNNQQQNPDNLGNAQQQQKQGDDQADKWKDLAQQGDDVKKKPAKGKGSPPAQTHVLCAIELKSGRIVWQRWIDSDVMTAPIAEGDELFVTSFAGTLYKFKQKDGAIVSAMSLRATSAPLIVKGNVVVSKRADDPKGNANKGDQKGKPPVEESIVSLSQDLNTRKAEFNRQKADYLDRGVQSSSELAKQGEQLDAGNGFAGGAPQQANPQAAMDNIGQGYVSTLQAFQGTRGLHLNGRLLSCPGDKIVCNDVQGKKLWSIPLKGDLKKVGGMLAAPPIHAGGKVFVSTLEGNILQVDPKQGNVEKTYKIGAPLRFPPIAQNGNLYIGTQNGKVVCIKTGDKSITGWTTWGGNSSHNKN